MRVTVVPLAPGVSRTRAYARAGGDVVAFLDTRYEQGPNWMLAAGKAPIVGGRVLPGPGYAWAGWVYYVVEYGWRERLAVGNVAYLRRTIEFIDEYNPGSGLVDYRMDVRLTHTPSFREYLRERFEFSKQWGALKVPKRAAILRLALPLLVILRSPWWRKPATLPGVVVISFVMMAGEISGSLWPRSVTLKS